MSATCVSQPSRVTKKLLIAKGVAIVPIYPGERSPKFTAWQDSATTDAETIRSWYDTGYPIKKKDGTFWMRPVTKEDNWCCVAKLGGKFMLDIDDVGAAKRRGMPELPITPITRTSGGGLHVFLASTPESFCWATATCTRTEPR